jgi:hypothetical protein
MVKPQAYIILSYELVWIMYYCWSSTGFHTVMNSIFAMSQKIEFPEMLVFVVSLHSHVGFSDCKFCRKYF